MSFSKAKYSQAPHKNAVGYAGKWEASEGSCFRHKWLQLKKKQLCPGAVSLTLSVSPCGSPTYTTLTLSPLVENTEIYIVYRCSDKKYWDMIFHPYHPALGDMWLCHPQGGQNIKNKIWFIFLILSHESRKCRSAAICYYWRVCWDDTRSDHMISLQQYRLTLSMSSPYKKQN